LGIIDNQPKVFNMKELLREFLNFRSETLRRQTQFRLEKANKNLEILTGVRKAILDIDRVVKLIKESKDNEDARSKLISLLEINDEQAKAILDMRLGRLTNLEVSKVDSEMAELETLIKNLNEILTNKNRFIKKSRMTSQELQINSAMQE